MKSPGFGVKISKKTLKPPPPVGSVGSVTSFGTGRGPTLKHSTGRGPTLAVAICFLGFHHVLKIMVFLTQWLDDFSTLRVKTNGGYINNTHCFNGGWNPRVFTLRKNDMEPTASPFWRGKTSSIHLHSLGVPCFFFISTLWFGRFWGSLAPPLSREIDHR